MSSNDNTSTTTTGRNGNGRSTSVRFAAPATATTSPSEAALSSTLPIVNSLHPLIQTTAHSYVKKTLTGLNHMRKTEANIIKLQSDTFTPRSIRLKFLLTSHRSVMDSEDFRSLATEATNVIDTFQNNMKSVIISTAELELLFARRSVLQTIFEGTAHIADLYCTIMGFPTDASTIYGYFLHAMVHPDIRTLLTEVESENGGEFMQNLCIDTPTDTNNIDRNTDSHNKFREIIWSLFIQPRTVYEQTIRENALLTAAQSKIVLHQRNKTTTDTIAMVEDELPVDSKTIGEMINRKINDKTKKLVAQLNHLTIQNSNKSRTSPTPTTTKKNSDKLHGQQQTTLKSKKQQRQRSLSPKNLNRGANSGAPSTKKSTSLSHQNQQRAKSTADRNSVSPKRSNDDGTSHARKKSRTSNRRDNKTSKK
jgi:hypothetical protein